MKDYANTSKVPSSRFQISDYYNADANSKNPRETSSKHGNFLDNPFEFDNGFFHISPREAKTMDPQQRLLLHAALEAMEDAGYAPNATPSFQTESTGVYVGVATLDYVDNLRNDIDVYYSPGTLRAFLSGRISFAFQLGGPSVVVDTACSSSTVALYQACRALQAGDCTSALAGGVNVMSSPDMYLGLSRAHFMSPSGQCKPWDASADGYCRAEGCGLFVLKRLSDAVKEGDRIHGVIRGIEVNQCGTAKSITHPDSTTQAKLFKQLFTKTQINPDTVGVVEAHGTGTQAGDYAEVTSLSSTFGSRASDNPLTLSSIKGNIGHAEAASGAAGLTKLLLMMRNQRIPPQAAHHTLNPRLASISSHNIHIPTKTTPWPSPPTGPPRRRALLNNFGAAGSNAALLLEEHLAPPPTPSSAPDRSTHLLNISAKTAPALESLRDSYAHLLDATPPSALGSLCYSANARRLEHAPFRLSLTGTSPTDLAQKLRRAPSPARVPPSAKPQSAVFVFSGQGAVHAGMGAELLATVPAFREAVEACNGVLVGAGFARVDALVGGGGAELDARSKAVVGQCACFVVEYALASMWMAWGVVPDVVVGHSLGEYAALVIAGVVELRDAVLLVARRAECMVERCEAGGSGMVACNIAPVEVEGVLAEGGFGGVSVACKNSTDDCVVAGPVEALKRFVAVCKERGQKVKLLDVPYGFHSKAMEPIREPLAEIAAEVRASSPKIPVVSSYLGRLLAANDVNADYFVNHARQPVEFVKAVGAISEVVGDSDRTFIEVGPAPISTFPHSLFLLQLLLTGFCGEALPMFKATLKDTQGTYLPSMKPTEKPWATLSSALRSLYLQRYSIHWRSVYDGAGVQFLDDLPHYPLSPSTFVVPFKEPAGTTSDVEADKVPEFTSPYKFLHGPRVSSSDGMTFESRMSSLADFIKAHNVGGSPLCPASVYIELALEALSLQEPESRPNFQVLSDITFNSPLVHSEGNDCSIHTSIANTSAFRVHSDGDNPHCTGTVSSARDGAVEKDFARRASYIKRQKTSASTLNTFSSRVLYDVIFPRVVSYSGPYLTIKNLNIAASGLEGYGTFQLPESGTDGFACPPAFTDTLLHAAGFIANVKISADEACICSQVERVTIPCGNSARYGEEMDVYCSLVECDGSIIADAWALDGSGQVVAAVEGMNFKRLRLKSFQAHLARLVKPEPAQKLNGPTASSTKGAHVANGINGVKHTNDVNGTHGSNHGLNSPAQPKRTPSKVTETASIRDVLQETVSELCGVDGPLDSNTSLSEMGIDSLMFIELTSTLQKQFSHLQLSKSNFESCETVLDIETAISAAAGGEASPPQSEVHEESAPSSSSSSVKSLPSTGSSTPSIDLGQVNEFLREVCGFTLQDVDKDMSLDSLGVDSLLSIELQAGMRQTFGVDLESSGGQNIADMTIREFEQAVLGRITPPSSIGDPEEDDEEEVPPEMSSNIKTIAGMDTFPVTLQHSTSGASPLYLIHDGSGLTNAYSRLSPLNRPTHGIYSLDFAHPDPSIRTMEDLATLYIRRANLASAPANIILGGKQAPHTPLPPNPQKN